MNNNQFFRPNSQLTGPPNGHMQLLPQGPTSPTIFIGHFGVSQSNDQVACFTGRELTLHQPVKLEGIHIVPYGIKPPGLPIEGKTLPSMTTRSFHLNMFVRNVADNKIISVFLLTIQGGVQWMAIPPPFNDMTVDFIAFEGDFEALSVIINGFPVNSGAALTNSPPVAEQAVVDLDSDDDEEDPAVEDEGKGDKVDKVDNPLYAVQLSARTAINSALAKLSSKLRKTPLRSGARAELASRIEYRLHSTWLGNSLVSIKSVAVLVGEIFSFAESYSGGETESRGAEEIRSKILLLNSLTTYMTDCWRDDDKETPLKEEVSPVGEEQPLEASSSPTPPPDSRDSVASVIGPEAANLLCSIVVQGFDLLHFESFLVSGVTAASLEGEGVGEERAVETNSSSGPNLTDTERRALFDQYTEALLKGCGAILANNFTASEFLDCGGVSVLGTLLQRQRQMSPPLFMLLLSVVSDAVRHYSLAVKFNEPVDADPLLEGGQQQEVSPYQSLLHIAADLKADAEELAHCSRALRWCALVESLGQLSLQAYSVFTEVSTVSDALAARHASVNNNTMGDAQSEDMEDSLAQSNIHSVLHASCGVVSTLLGAASTRVQDVLTALVAVQQDDLTNNSSATRDEMVPLLHTLSKGKIMMSLLALASLAQVAKDLSNSADWSAPQAAGLLDNTRALQTLLLSLLRELLRVPRVETLLCVHGEEVQLLFSFVCPTGCSLLTCRSLEELREAEEVHMGSGDLTHTLQSYGWALWLVSHVFSLCSAELHPLRGALEDDLVDLTAAQLASVKAWSSALNELTLSHVSLCVVLRVVSQFYLSDIGTLINRISLQYSLNSSDDGKLTLRWLLRVVELTCQSTDTLVSSSVVAQSVSLVASLKGAKESLAFSNIDSDDEEEEDEEKEEMEESKKLVPISQTVDSLLVALQPPVNTVDKTKYSRSSIFRKLLKSFALSTITKEDEALVFVRAVRDQLDDCRAASAGISQATTGSAVDILGKCTQHMTALQTHLATIVRGEGDNDSDGEEEPKATSAESSAVTPEDILASRPGVKDSLRYYATLNSVLRAVLSVVHYAVLTASTEVSTNSKIAAADIVHADRLVTVTVDVYCIVSRVVSTASCSSSAEAPRAVLLSCVEILRLFSPPHSSRADTCSLVPYLSKRAFRGRLRQFEEVCCLLDSLLPSRFDVPVCGESSDARRSEFENQHLSDQDAAGLSDLQLLHRKQLSLEEVQLSQWVAFVRRDLVTTRSSKGEALYHAVCSKASMLSTSSSTATLDAAAGTSKPKKRRFSDVAARPVDVLARSLADRKYSLEALVLAAAMGSSRATQRYATSLAHKYIALGRDFATSLSAALTSTFAHCVDAHVKPETEDGPELTRRQALLIHLLSFFDAACHEDVACFVLTQKGLLKSLFNVLQSIDAGVALLSLQVITTVYRTLSRCASRDATERASLASDDMDAFFDSSDVPAKDTLSFSSLLIVESLGALLAEQMPKTILKFQENLLILQQSAITLQLLSVVHNKQFQTHLAEIGSGVTLEFLAVKLWIAFEESFKLLSDSAIDPRKQRQMGKEEAAAAAVEQERTNCEGHVQFERASWALQAIVDCTFMAYTQGWVQLSTVARAMRASQTDPKKVARRVQRAYTMWAIGLATVAGDDGGYNRNVHTVVTSTALLYSLSENETFNSRHAVVCFALKSLVDNMNLLAEYLVRKEKTFAGATDSGLVCFGSGEGQVSQAHQKEITGIDLQAPFSAVNILFPDIESTLLDAWFTRLRYGERVSFGGEVQSLSAVDGDFQRDMVGFSDADRKDCFAVRFEAPVSSVGEARRRMAQARDEGKRKKVRLAETATASAAVAPASSAIPQQMVPPLANGGFNPMQFASPLGGGGGGGGFNLYPPFAAKGPRPTLAQGLPSFNSPHTGGHLPFVTHGMPPRPFVPPTGLPTSSAAAVSGAAAAAAAGTGAGHIPFQRPPQGGNQPYAQHLNQQPPPFLPGQVPPRPGMFPPGGPPGAQFPPHGAHNFPPPPQLHGLPGRGMPPPLFQHQQQPGRGPHGEFGRYN